MMAVEGARLADDAGPPGATSGEDGLTPLQHKAVLALLEKPTVTEAARVAGVHRATLYKWLREEPEFQAAHREARREVLRHVAARLQQISGEAVETLREVMSDKTQQGASRVGAARTVLDYAVKATEQQEVIERLDRLEGRRSP